MPDVSTNTAMHGHVDVVIRLAGCLETAINREEEKQFMQRILDAAVAYMVLAARERDYG